MNKIIFLFIFSLFFTNEFFASQEPNNNTLKSKLEAKIQHSEEKTKNAKKWADVSAVGVLGAKGVATGLEMMGFNAFTIIPLLGIIGGAVAEYGYEEAADRHHKTTNRFKAALNALDGKETDKKFHGLELDKVLAQKKSCKKTCTSAMGKKNANNFNEISWCALNCPNLILRDYMCEVFGNMKESTEDKKHILNRIASSFKTYLSVSKTEPKTKVDPNFQGKTDLIPLIAKIFADPFTKKYREYLQGKMLGAYYQAAFQFSVVQLSGFTNMAHKMEHAEFWSPDSDPDITSLVNSSFRKNSPMLGEIKGCFGSLCYTTIKEYDHEEKRTLVPDYYDKLIKKSKISDGKILSALTNRVFVPQSGIISLEDMNKLPEDASETPSSSSESNQADHHSTKKNDQKTWPSPFRNYCDYYFARTPINFHSRITNAFSNIKNLGGGKKYQEYFDDKVQERYNMITKSRETLKTFLEAFDEASKTPDTNSLKEKESELTTFMEKFSDFMEILQSKSLEKIQEWKKGDPEYYEQIVKVIAVHKANQQALPSN